MKCGGPSSSAKGGAARELVKGKRWLLLTRWVNLDAAETAAQFNPCSR